MKTYEPMAGEDVSETARRMVALAKKSKGVVKAKFNDIELTANPDSKANDIVKFYNAETTKRHEAWKKSPAGNRAAREAEEARKRAAAACAEGIKSFSLKDPDGWKQQVEKNQDGYGSGVIRFAARWANLMEQKMAKGAKLKDIAEKTSHEADSEGITGFMYGCAVSILSQVWEHGEELRCWHNLDTQLGDEGEKANKSGGVLNPALLSVGSK